MKRLSFSVGGWHFLLARVAFYWRPLCARYGHVRGVWLDWCGIYVSVLR